jgi:glycerophosphoryl diester phosphodiesterase
MREKAPKAQILGAEEPILVSRRNAIALSASSLLLAGCSSAGTANSRRPAAESHASHTIAQLLETTPFYIAHRGSGDNWPEHSALAYGNALDAGAKAIEVSVHATSDGVLVCHHDSNTLRMTGQSREIAATPFSELQQLSIDARQWIGPSTPLVRIPRLREVLDDHAVDHVIFIEDKTGKNADALLDVMDSYPNAKDHFIWKQPGSDPQYSLAAARGYRTWGYFLNDAEDPFSPFASHFDYLGIYLDAPDADVTKLVGYGKPVICWAIRSRQQRDRMVSLGVRGIMCSNIPYVTTAVAEDNKDRFSSGRRGDGDLPWMVGGTPQPTLQADSSSVILNGPTDSRYVMGSMCPIGKPSYSISFQMRWPRSLPALEMSAGIAFGRATDSFQPGTGGGYRFVVFPDGRLQLFRDDAVSGTRKQLLSLSTDAPTAGEWMSLSVQVTQSTVTLIRVGHAGWSASVGDQSYG